MGNNLLSITKKLAEQFRYDAGPNGKAKLGLYHLQKYCDGLDASQSASKKNCTEWIHNYTALQKAVATNGLNTIPTDKLKTLCSFSEPNSKEKSLVTSSVGQLFLGDFHEHYMPLILEVIHDRLIFESAIKFSGNWKKSMEILKKHLQSTIPSEFGVFVNNINALAEDNKFPVQFWQDMNTSAYAVDENKLKTALDGFGVSAEAVRDFEASMAKFLGRVPLEYGDRKKLEEIQREYKKDVHPLLKESGLTAQMINTLNNRPTLSVGRQFI